MSDTETELLVVPHTHWDREWYLTFQQFRMKLVDTVDAVLDTLESDPAFTFFMLDGQTIVLEDYLEIRPENASRLRSLALQGRLLVGPWYLQPDEFLVGGESLIRNLQRGQAISQIYGGAMPVGYVPDTFGHIAQLPQLLRGFGIDNAVFWRGVGPEIKRDAFTWRAPDGSEVLAAWLCDDYGYSNAALLPLDAETLAARAEAMAGRMRPWAAGRHTLLLMNGSDHLMPQAGLPEAIEEANRRLEESHLRLRIATLPEYLSALREAEMELPTHDGELRSSYRAHLLPGVYSTRMWLKQQNAAAETLLTRWAEPSTCWAWLLGEPFPETQLELAWKFLMQNHPHDSICGCGIDQVHREMLPRFAQSQQIAGELVERALRSLAARVETRGPHDGVPVVVFNASGGPRTEVVGCTAQTRFSRFQVVDTSERPMPHQVIAHNGTELLDQSADKALVMGMLGLISDGRALGYTILEANVGFIREDGSVPIEILVAEHGTPNLKAIEIALAHIRKLAENENVTAFHITAREAATIELLLLAEDVPPHGGKVFFLQPVTPRGPADDGSQTLPPAGTGTGTSTYPVPVQAGSTWLENELLRVEVETSDGTLTLQDKVRNVRYVGLNQFVDGGDVGDLYTYCPPAHDMEIASPVEPALVELVETGPARACLRMRQTYRLPVSCSEDRATRSLTSAHCEIVSEVSLSAGSRRVEFRTSLDNPASDHRLRVLFPVPFHTKVVDAEGAFEVTPRPVEPVETPAGDDRLDAGWAELPVNTQPQRRFADLSDGDHGLAVLNRGLPEYEVLSTHSGSAFALTLLRSTGWLSRNDLRTRHGHAGPALATPEAQGLGSHSFEYALVPHAGTWEASGALVLQEAQAYETPMRAHVAEPHAGTGTLPGSWSFVRVAPPDLVVTAIKRAADGEGLILRLYNPFSREVSAEIALATPFEEVEMVDLSERALSGSASRPLARILSEGVHTTLRGGEIQTLRFRMAPLAMDFGRAK